MPTLSLASNYTLEMMSPNQYLVTLFVDESALKQAYIEGHDISPDDCPDLESMIESELHWLSNSGISFDHIQPKMLDDSIKIEWSIYDIRDRARLSNLNLDDEQCRQVLEYLQQNYDANLGITWHTIDNALEFYS